MLLFYNSLIIPNDNHPATDETDDDDRDGSDSVSEARPVRDFE